MSENAVRKDTSELAEKADTLVVVSKVKKLIRDRAGLNTSQDAVDSLTAMIASACERAIARARDAGRKTVMGRDFDQAE